MEGAKPGEPSWDSPWGKGRPGWHIECSAMSTVHLGETVDIHCGGQDLIFPHHENEVAQSEGAFGKPFVNYWMHNGFLNIDDEKMSKSLGNFFTVRDILKKYDAETVRMFLLSAHYRNPLNFSEDILKQTEASLQRLYTARDKALFLQGKASGDEYKQGEDEIVKAIDETLTKFENAMDDDLNTAEGMGALFELVYIMNTELSGESSKKLVDYSLNTLNKICDVLGLLMKGAEELPEEVQKLAKEREIARKEKNWALSDELRDKISAMGYTVEDTPKDKIWEPAGCLSSTQENSFYEGAFFCAQPSVTLENEGMHCFAIPSKRTRCFGLLWGEQYPLGVVASIVLLWLNFRRNRAGLKPQFILFDLLFM